MSRSRFTRYRRRLPRTTIMFFGGLGLVVFEAGFRPSPSGAIVGAALLMMGLPIAEASDMFRNRMLDTWDEERDFDLARERAIRRARKNRREGDDER